MDREAIKKKVLEIVRSREDEISESSSTIDEVIASLPDMGLSRRDVKGAIWKLVGLGEISLTPEWDIFPFGYRHKKPAE